MLLGTAMRMRWWMWLGCFLNTAPEDRSGEDRTLVVVQVSAENLARKVPAGTPEARPAGVDPVGNVPAGTPEARPAGVDPVRNVPAGTSSPESAVCHIEGSARLNRRPRNGLPATTRCWAR
jgi:hypothetical protein